MYVKSMTIENVKSFRGEHHVPFTDGLNFLVGDNNGGKSTVFEALEFVFDGSSATKRTPDSFYSTDATGPTRVTVDLADDVHDLVATEKFARYAGFVFDDDDGTAVLRLQRSSEDRTISQGGRTVALNVKKLCFWNPATGQFENPSGIDALAKSIIDIEAIWADTSPGDVIDFGTTKTLGRLLDAVFRRFATTAQWQTFTEAHAAAFSGSEGSFVEQTASVAAELEELVQQQYGHATVRFGFELPDAATFTKMGSLLVDDGAGETAIAGKGTGMQRAMTLGVIQLYAKSEALGDGTSSKPLLLLLDEPETWLHPNAQLRLAEALSQIAEHEQVFVITHSPYLIRKFDSSRHRLAVFAGQGESRTITHSPNMGMLGPGEPSWGEINFRAFDICSVEFHNELYGRVQLHVDARLGRTARESELDEFLVESGIGRTRTWVRSSTATYPVTLPVYVRNGIHHPENSLNLAPSDAEFRESTESLVALVEQLVPARPSGDPATPAD